MGVLWFLYMSIVHVGQDWYGYGWEIQLTETGFLAIFSLPINGYAPLSRDGRHLFLDHCFIPLVDFPYYAWFGVDKIPRG